MVDESERQTDSTVTKVRWNPLENGDNKGGDITERVLPILPRQCWTHGHK